MKINLLLAFGDNAISLFLLNQLNCPKYVEGTYLTKKVMELCEFDNKFHLTHNFIKIPAFYNIKNSSLLNIIKDFIKFYFLLKEGDYEINILEKEDFRSKILSLISFNFFYTPLRNKNVYLDRKALIEELYSQDLILHPLARYSNGTNIVINPTSRLEIKNIKINELKLIINILNINGKEVTLIDYDGRYKELKSSVSLYYEKTELNFAVELLKKSDFYIGADSFFIHLSYIFKIPFYIYFNFENEYFMPPFCIKENNFIVSSKYNMDTMKKKLCNDLTRLKLITNKIQ
jgi:ADP-heptose:LPS heptosyltransferase